jgi:hypothetical protein
MFGGFLWGNTSHLHSCLGTVKLKTEVASWGFVLVGSKVTDSSLSVLPRIASWPYVNEHPVSD